MKRSTLRMAGLGLLGLASAFAGSREPGGHVSLTSKVLATFEPEVAEKVTPESMAIAARDFLGALGDERRAQASFELESKERAVWTNTPPGTDEGGVRLGDCTEAELQAACGLLRAVLSEDGYGKVRDILLGDDLLLRDGQPRRGFGAENFWLAVFGEPSAKAKWALQLDGHHLALNMTFEDGALGMSPTFLGAQPAEFARGEAQAEPLGPDSQRAFALLEALSEEQRVQAVIAERRGPNRAAAGRDGQVPEARGLACKELDAKQRGLLLELLGSTVHTLPEPWAERRMEELAEAVPSMHFAWSGPVKHPADVSFEVQGPGLILEFACQDLGGDPLQHLHLMYRDPTQEYAAR